MEMQMANVQRSRLALEAWREHLITAHEALEISGLETERELRAIVEGEMQEASDERTETPD
jgi:hypothetical protein